MRSHLLLPIFVLGLSLVLGVAAQGCGKGESAFTVCLPCQQQFSGTLSFDQDQFSFSIGDSTPLDGTNQTVVVDGEV